MNEMTDDYYEFERVPIEPIRTGSSVLVSGPSHAGTRELALRLLATGEREGVVVVTTNRKADRMKEECEAAGIDVGSDQMGIVDCVGTQTEGIDAKVKTAAGPGDLTGIGMRFSKLHQELEQEGYSRIRSGFFSVSTLLSFTELNIVSRFVHTALGRINSVGGLGILLVDPETHDDRSVSTISQFCDGLLEVRETGDEGPEMRLRGLPGQERTWQSFDPYEE
jgi:KaiC/GvpD/RAD55 family RecA-like ATPase